MIKSFGKISGFFKSVSLAVLTAALLVTVPGSNVWAAVNEDGEYEEAEEIESVINIEDVDLGYTRLLKDFAIDTDNWSDWSNMIEPGDLDGVYGKIMTIGEYDVPILILYNENVSHADGYVRIYKYVEGEIVLAETNDYIGGIFEDAGVVRLCHSGGGYGEVDSYYYYITEYNEQDYYLGCKSELTPDEGLFNDEGIFDREFYDECRSSFPEDVYVMEEADCTREEFLIYLAENGCVNETTFDGYMEDWMTPVSEWEDIEEQSYIDCLNYSGEIYDEFFGSSYFVTSDFYETDTTRVAFVDLNNDGTDEMIMDSEGWFRIFYLFHGNVIYADSPFYTGASGELLTADGQLVMVDSNHAGTEYYEVYDFTKECKFAERLSFNCWSDAEGPDDEDAEVTYYVNYGYEREADEEEFNGLVEEYTGEENLMELNWFELD